ncbi:peptidase S9 prolyl oligopeptidase active site domain protein [Hymenobacter roseosalivarius DSM 11622]|uniref:Peptidase S9 prolyl oligopeptidase active site domain protein n=1 Tax=Hymenobacter roseosalivarius DSM 11622 TaxID=645990 RepID=A0A1W1UIC1_9BACT|nr:S9 family peptidase [Hymenobacter roseosalivarius]SMB80820.1 peptidase S9 prolyl oligopeptidase active site domain protein [Hymenobacter roseosalivarius DSM 11622]
MTTHAWHHLTLVLLVLCGAVPSYAQPTPAKLRADIVAMASMGYCRAGGYLANGNEVVFISNRSGSPQVWKVPAAGGKPVQLTALPDPVTALVPSPKRDQIAFQVAPGGGLNAQLYVMKGDGSGVKQITKGGKTNNFLGTWSKDGTLLSFGSNDQNPTGVDFFLYDVRKGTAALAIQNKGTGGIADFSRDNKQVLVTRLASRGSNDLSLYTVATKAEKLLTPHEGPGTFFGKIAPSGEVYLGFNKDRDLLAFGQSSPNGLQLLAERKDAELADFTLNHAGTTAVLVWNESGRSKLTLYDLKAKKESRQLSLPVELVAGVAFSPTDQTLVFTGSGSKEPANIWVYAVGSNHFQKITDSPHPGVSLATLVAPELVSFPSFDGVPLSGWLYKPKTGKGPFPTVISYHGGPEGQSVPSLNPTAQALVQQGVAFFLPNVRGSSGFGKTFLNLDNGALRVNGVKDIKAVSEYLLQAGIAKPGALGIMGGSYGGYMVMAGVTHYPDMFAAGANLFGVVNFETFFQHTEPWMAAISTVEYGDPVTQGAMLRELSPIHQADRIKTPLLVEHGANDTNVPVVEAEQVVAALQKNNVPVQYTLFPDEGHGWQKTTNRITSTVEIVEWFTTRLK